MLELPAEKDLEDLVGELGFQFREKDKALSLVSDIRNRLAYDLFYKDLEKKDGQGMSLLFAQAAYIALCYLDYFACSQNLHDGNKRLALAACLYFLERNKFVLLPERFSPKRMRDLIMNLIQDNSENKSGEGRDFRLQKYYKALKEGLDYRGEKFFLVSD